MSNKANSEPVTVPEVAAVYDAYPEEIREKLMVLHKLILETADSIKAVGEIEECLKWGEPSFLTSETKAGSTIRIDWKGPQKEEYAMYFKCTANLVPAFKERYPDLFRYGGDRSILFYMDEQIPVKELKTCIALALTYHLNKKLETRERWEMVERFLMEDKRESGSRRK